ncbi:hypothetical protein SLA2020_420370 [Shorea laevis]
MLPSPVDFLNIFILHLRCPYGFLEKYTNKVKDSHAQVEIHIMLLELYLSNYLNFPSISLTAMEILILEALECQKPSVQWKFVADRKDSSKEKDWWKGGQGATFA